MEAGDVPFELTIQMEYSMFDCPSVAFGMSQVIGAPFRVQQTRSGSAIIAGSTTPEGITNLRSCVEASSCGFPASEMRSNGQTSVPNNGNNAAGRAIALWIIILASIVGVMVVAGAIVLIVICCKRRQTNYNYKTTSTINSYAPAVSTSARANAYNAEPMQVYSGPTAAVSAAKVTLRLNYAVVDEGEGILKAQKGDVVQCDHEDFVKDDPWLYVSMVQGSLRAGQAGYVPRAYCVKT